MDSYDSESRRIFQHFSRSTRFKKPLHSSKLNFLKKSHYVKDQGSRIKDRMVIENALDLKEKSPFSACPWAPSKSSGAYWGRSENKKSRKEKSTYSRKTVSKQKRNPQEPAGKAGSESKKSATNTCQRWNRKSTSIMQHAFGEKLAFCAPCTHQAHSESTRIRCIRLKCF